MATLRLKRCYFTPQRAEFTFAEDIYPDWVILAAQSGRFAYSIHDASTSSGEAGFGDLLICPPTSILKRKALEPVSFHFMEFTIAGANPPIGKVMVRDIPRLASTFNSLKQMMDEPLEIQNEYTLHLIQDLLQLIAKEKRYAEHHKEGTTDLLMRRALTYIEQHAYSLELSMQTLAEKLNISASQLTRRFQAAYRLSPVAYATSLRLQKARTLLVDTEQNLDEIAEQCGYQNGFYLSRIFTAKLKINPSMYRRTYRF